MVTDSHFNQMDFFTDTNQIKAKKVVIIPPLYNNDKTLEFLIQPEKHLFYPNEIFLHFNIEIPPEYLMDNQAADKLFDTVEVQLNNSKITNNSSSNEYLLSSYFKSRANYPTDVLESSMIPMGFFGTMSFDSPIYQAHKAGEKRQFEKNHTHHEVKDHNGAVTSRVYNIITPIMSPIFQQTKPLPSNVSISINFRRSIAAIPLIQIAEDSKKTYESKNIELKDVYLECNYLDENIIDKKYNFVTNNELKYTLEEPVIRTFTIDKGLNTATINVNTGGRLPFMLFATLTTPAAFFGDLEKSVTLFTRKTITSFDVLLDNTSLPGAKVQMSDKSMVEPYVAFLRNTKLYTNALAGKTMRLGEFNLSNYILSYDLTTIKQETGWLSLKFDFEGYLAEKTMIIVYMLYDKQLVINKDREIIINN